MKRALPGSLFGQLLLGIILVQSVFLGGFILYTVVSQRNIAQQRSRQRIDDQLDLIGEACSREMAVGNMASLQEVLEVARVAPSIVAARVTDLQGNTLAVTKTGREFGLDPFEQAVLKRPAERQVFTIKNGQMEAMTPIRRDGRPVALLWLEPNRAPALTAMRTVVRIALSYGVLALLVNIIPIFLIVRTITNPLRRLREATQRVGSNIEANTDFPLPVTTSNEAGALTLSFNAMVGELQHQRRGLLETLALLDSMLDNAPIGLAFFDRELRYVRVNDALARMHQLPMERHLGKRGTELYPWSIAEHKEAYLSRVFKTGEAIRNVEFSGELSHAPGEPRNWLMHFYPVRIQSNQIQWVGAIVIDITERLRTEEALRKTEKLAATGRLAASIAHEINNPLESVTNLLYLLETHEPMDSAAREMVSTAQAELARVSEITQQTLRFHRQSSLPGPANVTEILSSLLILYRARITAAKVTVARKFQGAPEVFGFAGELRQLLANLINNALDAMPHGGCLSLNVRCGTGLCSDGSFRSGVRIAVSDTGTGMSQETVRKVFEAFFTTKQDTGIGLGLWVCEEIIRKHSGTVKVRSRQGEKSGTTFMIFLPDTGPNSLVHTA